MKARPSVPRMAAVLVSASLPRRERGLLLGDLQEQFFRRAEARGLGAARRWYWVQAVGIVLALGPRRAWSAAARLGSWGTLRTALRSLLRSPGISLASAATLAVGMAAPVAMFALADGVTSSLPGDPADRIVRVSRLEGGGSVVTGIPWPVVEWLRENHAAGEGRALSALAAFRSDGPVAVGDGEGPAGRYWGVYATAGLYELVGVSPILGRLYDDDEELGMPAALIREDLWEGLYDRDPGILGARLRIDGVDHVVVGVLPRAFGFPVDHSVWMQRGGDEDEIWSVVGLLADGAEPGVAREQLRSAASAGVAPVPGSRRRQEPLTPLVERYTTAHFANDNGDEITRYVGWASLILVILTALNVAALMVARGVTRARETAIRRAMGATRVQIMALMLTENLILALAGGVLGLFLGQMALQAMVRYLTGQATIIPYWMDFSLGIESVLIAGALVILALAVSGVLPALRTSRVDLDHALRVRPRDAWGSASRGMRWIVGLEVTLSCFLLTLSAVVVGEAREQLSTGVGFSSDRVLTAQLLLDEQTYPDPASRAVFLGGLMESLGTHPSVESASLSTTLPGKAGASLPVALEGGWDGSADPARAQVRSLDSRFLDLLHVPLLAGRPFAESDDATGEPVALVNEAFTRRHGIAGAAVGQTLSVGNLFGEKAHVATIVGVVADRGVTPYERGRPVPGVFLPVEQAPARTAYLLVRTRGDAVLPEVWQDVARRIDPYLPLGEVLSLDETLRRGHGSVTLFGSVFLALGASALLVAMVGLHGVHSFNLARRVREMGLRRAMGAREGQITAESMRRGLWPVWAGVVLGTVPGVLLARVFLPVEPGLPSILMAPVLLLAVSLFALWRPARTASGANPMEALREG